MSSEIINDKERTNNIRMIKLIAVIFMSLLISGMKAENASEKTWIIVIDAGHGGKDPGAVGKISREKNINLAIALKTGEYLEQNVENVSVLYTRKTDEFMELRDRPEFANKNNADLFISIHSNWISKSTIKGSETWIMGPAQNDQNLEVAMKENEVILLEDDFSTKYEGFDPKSPESYIMFTVMQNTFRQQSTLLASTIQSQLKNRAGRIDRGVKQAGFWVLYMTTMPSVLVETGFITNPDEEKYLVSKEGQDYIASAIYRAIRDYINEIDKKTNISTSKEKEQVSTPDSSVSDRVPVVDELRYMIQIATSAVKKSLTPDNFKGFKDVVELSSQNLFRYATGSFSSYQQAAEYRNKIEAIYPDAFVIAVKNNKIVPLQDALNSK
ncbi:MAG TPA: N-acetylmuramoyl-L-alanine amidase [Bacteroidales bacterium]|nr:N-acetylmuramoyl-L-alanine amidase [Bacteroidales bacterium]HBZ22320.1 N-acetylmuramoyl-L-alanine amidase [Bacteroidales bacterium]